MNDLQRIKDLAVSDSGFVFDPYSGATFSLNASGMSLLAGIKEGSSRDMLMARLTDEFDTTGADLNRDVDEFVQLLRENAIVSTTFFLGDVDEQGGTRR